MIISKLKGGLGNQLFQYAIGRQMAEIQNTELKIDVSFYNSQSEATPRNYKLIPFKITAQQASDDDIHKVLGSTWIQPLKRRLWKMGPDFFHWNYFREDVFGFHPEVLEFKGDAMLEGYWQSERYFKSIRSLLLDELTLKNQFLTKKFEDLAKEICNCESVAIHIRRGDYVNHPIVSKEFGVCSLDYYKNAMQEMTNRLQSPVFYVFSDDLVWCQTNLPLVESLHYVSGFKDFEDLVLMSNCHHQIIANSSFSWWGAWLNRNPNKNVIAPKQWFTCIEFDTSNVVPDSWTRL